VASPKTIIRKRFPKLRVAEFVVHSNPDPDYNCVGFAVNEIPLRFWWPGKGVWPPGLPSDDAPQNFVNAFRTFGYEPCDSFKLEADFEKIALYVREDDGRAKHVARQLPDGRWISKLGQSWDIIHKTPFGLAGSEYGDPKLALRRPRKS